MARLRVRAHDESGFTLVELLVAMTLMLVVMGIASGGVITALQNQRRQMGYVDALNNSKIVMERFGRAVRNANPVDTAAANDIVMRWQAGDVETTVRYRRVTNAAGCPDNQCLLWSESRRNMTTNVTTDVATDRVMLRNMALAASEPTFVYLDGDGNAVTAAGDVQRVRVALRVLVPETSTPIDLVNEFSVRNGGAR